MSLTSFVMGLLDPRDPELLTQAQAQLTSLFLDGARAQGAADRRRRPERMRPSR